ncbi:MFS transporter [Winogradskyella helgolandensis]|uniref:MFS transporter n=1 Tax=Winogradskyella helgolandensis TaxID=2697010 RepID=UPI0015C7B6FB|nr:MFS transporter [Winogradskyella helgolandensis]
MNRILHQKHNKQTFYYSLSRLFERASYYGLRTLLIIYMTGEILKMDRDEALSIYGWFILGFTIFQIIGALLGDLVIGNRKTIIIGGVLQAIGSFTLCLPSAMGLYVGLALVVLGSGFYSPNMVSNFGKLYLNKTKLLDSGFTLLYLAVNLGSFLGILLIGYLGEKFGYNIGFITAGLLMLISIIPIVISKEEVTIITSNSEWSLNKRILKISIVFILVGLYWGIYQITGFRHYDLQHDFREMTILNMSDNIWSSINTIFILPIGIIAVIVWTYFYSSQYFKLMIGFISGAISFGILYLIPEIPTEKHVTLYFLFLFFLGIAEIHIAPIIHSKLTKYSNPKYLSILVSLIFLPTGLISLFFGWFNERFYDHPIYGLKFGIIAMAILSIVLVGLVLWNKKTFNKEVAN